MKTTPVLAFLALSLIFIQDLLAQYEPQIIDYSPPLNPTEWDIVVLARPEYYDENLDALHASYIIDAAANAEGEYLYEDELTMYFRFENRILLDRFLDLMDSTTWIDSQQRLRFRDIVVSAEILTPGGNVHAPPNDPWYVNDWQCHIDLIKIQQSWDILPPTINPVIVAVLDTGIDATHEDLLGRIDSNGKNFSCAPGTAPTDGTGHGTRVSGIVGAITGNQTGIAGCAPPASSGAPLLTILPVKVFQFETDSCTTANSVAKAINHAVKKNAGAINMSFDLLSSSSSLNDAIANAVESGVVLVGSAGNDDNNTPGQFSSEAEFAHFPASDPDVISVGSVSCGNHKAFHSNWGKEVEVGAVGKSIRSTGPNNTYPKLVPPGTSFAAPQVTALAALIRGILPLATVQDIKDLITDNVQETLHESNEPKPFKHGTVRFKQSVAAANGFVVGAPVCPTVAADAPRKFKGQKPFKKDFHTLISGVESPISLKDKNDKCAVLTALSQSAPNDDAFFLAKSKKVKKKHTTEFELRFLLDTFPTSSLKLRLEGELLSDQGQDREIQVRFYNYSQGKWGSAINKVASHDTPFGLGFTIVSNLFDHIKTPAGWVRCKVKVRHLSSMAKGVRFDLLVDRAKIVVN